MSSQTSALADPPAMGQASSGPFVARHRETIGCVILGVVLFLACVGFNPLALPSPRDMQGGDASRQLSYMTVFVLIVWLQNLLSFPSRLARVPTPYWLLFAWCLISLSWSLVPMTGLQRLGLTIIMVVTIFLSTDAAGYRRTTKTLQIVLLGLVLADFVAVALFPLSAIHQYGVVDPKLIGNWKGLSEQKNLAGAICATAILFYLLSPFKVGTLLRVFAIVAAGVFLYMSKSKTSMGVGSAALLIGLLYRYTPPHNRRLVLVIGLLAAVGLYQVGSFLFSAKLDAYLNEPDSLTGRTQIWAFLIEYAMAHPLTGAGSGSFWTYNDASPIHQLADNWVEVSPNGHNGYLDTLVAIGFPGLALAIAAVFLIPIGQLILTRGIASRDGALPLALLFFGLMHNLSESTMMNRDAEVWLFTLIGGALTQQLVDKARRQATPA
ncbi:O-antigen ligase family protein [Maritimibacter alkaliphilus]|uniref:O-antigen ligase family protein n=1 Tax=Maritimibacter alkaliphilus TaxID=404236 RepID=UPI001C965C1C|nr:O-antigen ligase family protein [Maritimibacter alkaliphilus]MBY6090993.1 O-antigen ligase family protein [Maritimibacter alkaliphilus]